MSEPRTLKAPFGELTVHVRRSLNLLALRTQSNNLCHQDARLFSVFFFLIFLKKYFLIKEKLHFIGFSFQFSTHLS